MKENETISQLISKLKSLKTSISKRDLMSDKLFNLDLKSPQRQRLNASLDFECINIDKLKTDIARLYKGSDIEVGKEEKQYNPTGFHSYKH